MAGLLEHAAAIMSNESKRLEIQASNLANLATAGYKQRVAFGELLGSNPMVASLPPSVLVSLDFSSGKIISPETPGQISVMGDGFFEVRLNGIAYATKLGSFKVNGAGQLVHPSGAVLQLAGGADAVVKSRDWHFEADGSLVDEGRPVGRVKIIRFGDLQALQAVGGSLFLMGDQRAIEVNEATLRPGLEASNTSSTNSMLKMIEALRRAEAGQKLVHAWDDMMGRVLRAPSE